MVWKGGEEREREKGREERLGGRGSPKGEERKSESRREYGKRERE